MANSSESRPPSAACEKSSVIASQSMNTGSELGEYARTPTLPSVSGNMFSTANSTPCTPASSRMVASNRRAYPACQRNGGCTTTVDAPSVAASSAERSSLRTGLVPQTS